MDYIDTPSPEEQAHERMMRRLYYWSIGLFILWLLFSVYKAIEDDFRAKIEEKANENREAFKQCKLQLTANRCLQETPLPALELKCGEWSACMETYKNPYHIDHTLQFKTEILAQAFNGLFAKMSWGAIFGFGACMLVVSLSGMLLGKNAGQHHASPAHRSWRL